MTTAAPASTAPGPKSAPPRTAARPAKRQPSDQRDHESKDPLATVSPALAFLAVLQSLTGTVAPTINHGSSTSLTAGPKAGGTATPVVALGKASGQPATASETTITSGAAASPHQTDGGAVSVSTPIGPPGAMPRASQAGAAGQTSNRPSVVPASASIVPTAAVAGQQAAGDGARPVAATIRPPGNGSAAPKQPAPPSGVAPAGGPPPPVAAGPASAATGQGPAQTPPGQRAPTGAVTRPGQPSPARSGDLSPESSTTASELAGPIKPNLAVGVAAWGRAKTAADGSGGGKKAPTKSDATAAGGSLRSAPVVAPGLAPGPAAPPGASAPADLTQTVPAQVIQQLLEQPPRANTTVVLRLDPPLLGSVVLRVVAGDGNRIRLHFGVDDPSVGDALVGGLGRLESALRAQGLSPQGLSVSLNNTQLGSGSPGQSGQESPRSFGSRREPGAPIPTQPSSDAVSAIRATGGRYIDYFL